jgi:predicted nucleic acid-binding protein
MSLVDTDVLIDYLRGLPDAAEYFLKNKDNIKVSAYSYLELIQGCRSKSELSIVEKFLSSFSVIESESRITIIAREILSRRYFRDGTEIIDALIAATAINSWSGIEITRNFKHYRNIDGLKLKSHTKIIV